MRPASFSGPSVLSVLGLATMAAASLLGCQASVSGKVSTGSKPDVSEQADFDKPLDANTVSPSQVASDEAAAKDVALLGARQDLSFHGPSTAACKCMQVAIGQPGDVAFQWAGERPHTSHDGELVFAMSSAGTACPGATGELPGVSYWGYQVVGNDVVVVVENASPGRPVASGAIIPRPTGNGQVYVRPADKKVPYGRPISGAGDRCQIGKLDPVAPAVAPPSKATTGDQPSPFSAESQAP